MKRCRALLINPYIYDVAAYGFWSAPLGLLYVGSVLRANGFEVDLIDCMVMDEARTKQDGRGPFVKSRVPAFGPEKIVGKRFKRYGMGPGELVRRMESLEEPDLVLVTCIMTHWYSGAAEVVRLARQRYPRARVVVGGVYALLCHGHALATMGADLVVGPGGLGPFYELCEMVCGREIRTRPEVNDLAAFPYPCLDLGRGGYAPILTSVGCGFRCSYCATPYLHPKTSRREPTGVLEEITHWYERGVSRFALYDDAFLRERESHAKPILEGVARLPHALSFYNPNAMHAALVDDEVAALLNAAGFAEVRLGFETAEEGLQRTTGGKVDAAGFERAVGLLRAAGFEGGQIGAYVLAGLPGQRWEGALASAEYVGGLGVRIHLAEYSPVPHTPLFEEHCERARYPIREEPLFQNKALFPFAWEGFTEGDLQKIKARVRELNQRLAKETGSARGTTSVAGEGRV